MLHTALHGSTLRSSLLSLSQGSSSCCRLSSILQQQAAPRLGALPLMMGGSKHSITRAAALDGRAVDG